MSITSITWHLQGEEEITDDGILLFVDEKIKDKTRKCLWHYDCWTYIYFAIYIDSFIHLQEKSWPWSGLLQEYVVLTYCLHIKLLLAVCIVYVLISMYCICIEQEISQADYTKHQLGFLLNFIIYFIWIKTYKILFVCSVIVLLQVLLSFRQF